MAYETKDNTGSLFRNGRKEKESHPDYSGSVKIDGHDMWISAWLKEDKNKQKYFSLSFKRKDGTADRPSTAGEYREAVKRNFPDADLSDDLPF